MYAPVLQEIDPPKFIPIDPQCDSRTLTPRMIAYIKMTGLEHLAKLKKCKIDYTLINALVERWRPETNTFHFMGGKKIVTLEDVPYLYGLLIDRKAMIGLVSSNRVKLEDTNRRMLNYEKWPSQYLRPLNTSGSISLDVFI